MALSLFDHRLAPLTYSIGFINAPIDDVVHAFEHRLTSTYDGGEILQLSGSLQESLLRLQPLTIGIRPRILLASTTSPNWTALFDAHANGQGVAQDTTVTAQKLKTRGYYVACSPPMGKTDGKLGGRHFRVLGPETLLGEIRSVDLIENNPGRWYFEVGGEVQPYEVLEAYERRRKTERFTEDMLVDYAAAVGLRPWDESFYTSPYYLITSEGRPVRSYTLEQAREKLGLPPVA